MPVSVMLIPLYADDGRFRAGAEPQDLEYPFETFCGNHFPDVGEERPIHRETAESSRLFFRRESFELSKVESIPNHPRTVGPEPIGQGLRVRHDHALR